MRAIRLAAEAKASPESITGIAGSDIDPEALTLAKKHLQQAGIGGRVTLREADVAGLSVPGEGGTFLCNPPYGERLKKGEDLSPLYRSLRDLTLRHPGWHLCLLTGDPGFERGFGRRADKRRRLYNGRLECTLLTFFPSSGRRMKG